VIERWYAPRVSRDRHLRRALVLSAISVALSGVLGLLAMAVGLATERLSLLGFGFDAAIDSVASIVLVWRFRIESGDPARADRAEQIAERVIGAVLLVLATYLAINAMQALVTGSHPETTTVGLGISVVSLLVLPPLALAKNRVAAEMGSRALRADSILTGIAALLALISLVGFALTEWLGVGSADAVGGLLVAIVLVREGWSAFRRDGLEELAD
jgi:divalent metal cation (Fe/Co/Zn/Cd) transporter